MLVEGCDVVEVEGCVDVDGRDGVELEVEDVFRVGALVELEDVPAGRDVGDELVGALVELAVGTADDDAAGACDDDTGAGAPAEALLVADALGRNKAVDDAETTPDAEDEEARGLRMPSGSDVADDALTREVPAQAELPDCEVAAPAEPPDVPAEFVGVALVALGEAGCELDVDAEGTGSACGRAPCPEPLACTTATTRTAARPVRPVAANAVPL